jgi:hypothetical protein
MNNQIKFKDYDYDTNSFRYFDLDGYDRNEHDCYGNIMQFICKKDKNNKDIYEKDIVIDNVGRKWIVEFNELTCAFMFVYHKNNNQQIYYHQFIKRQLPLEIIGNIYENSDLLS